MKQSRYPKILLIVLVFTLPFICPWVRADGVGYYAYARSLLVEHHLRFENDWRHANLSFRMYSVAPDGQIDPAAYTPTGYLDNRYAVGASLLWAPFLVPVHGVMRVLQRFGSPVQADGFSRPYVLTVAIATVLYGFAGLLISFRFASLFIPERRSLLATLAMWFASSLPVYMYFDPAYSHALSVFAVALFLGYWQRTRFRRTPTQWVVLGLLSGLMLNLYYPNIAILVFPFLESVRCYWRAWRAPQHDWKAAGGLLLANGIYLFATTVAFLPTLITRQIIYGRPWELGYEDLGISHWALPALWQPLFSSNHGLLTWTPIIVPAVVGLALLRKYDKELAAYSLAAGVAFYYIVACHPDWHGVSSFGNRFFISLTPLFILGLAVTLHEVAHRFKQERAADLASVGVVAALIVWNLAFIFQWGTGLVPRRGPISWKQMAYNQLVVVPRKAGEVLALYFTHRDTVMQRLELQNVQTVLENRPRGAVEP